MLLLQQRNHSINPEDILMKNCGKRVGFTYITLDIRKKPATLNTIVYVNCDRLFDLRNDTVELENMADTLQVALWTLSKKMGLLRYK